MNRLQFSIKSWVWAVVLIVTTTVCSAALSQHSDFVRPGFYEQVTDLVFFGPLLEDRLLYNSGMTVDSFAEFSGGYSDRNGPVRGELRGGLRLNLWHSPENTLLLRSDLSVDSDFDSYYELSDEATVIPLSGVHDLVASLGFGRRAGMYFQLNASFEHEGKGPRPALYPISLAPMPYHREQLKLRASLQASKRDKLSMDPVSICYVIDRVGYTDPFALISRSFTHGIWVGGLGSNLGPKISFYLLSFRFLRTRFPDGYIAEVDRTDIRFLNIDFNMGRDSFAIGIKIDAGWTMMEEQQTARSSHLFIGTIAFALKMGVFSLGFSTFHDGSFSPEGERFVARLRNEGYVDLWFEEVGVGGVFRVVYEWLNDANFLSKEESTSEGIYFYDETHEKNDSVKRLMIEGRVSYELFDGWQIGILGQALLTPSVGYNKWDLWDYPSEWSHHIGLFVRWQTGHRSVHKKQPF